MSWLIDFIGAILQWVVDNAYNACLWLYQVLCELAVAAVDAIPTPSWVEDGDSIAASLHPGVAFFLQMAELPIGVAIIGSAYLIRFVIRRIPVVG